MRNDRVSDHTLPLILKPDLDLSPYNNADYAADLCQLDELIEAA